MGCAEHLRTPTPLLGNFRISIAVRCMPRSFLVWIGDRAAVGRWGLRSKQQRCGGRWCCTPSTIFQATCPCAVHQALYTCTVVAAALHTDGCLFRRRRYWRVARGIALPVQTRLTALLVSLPALNAEVFSLKNQSIRKGKCDPYADDCVACAVRRR